MEGGAERVALRSLLEGVIGVDRDRKLLEIKEELIDVLLSTAAWDSFGVLNDILRENGVTKGWKCCVLIGGSAWCFEITEETLKGIAGEVVWGVLLGKVVYRAAEIIQRIAEVGEESNNVDVVEEKLTAWYLEDLIEMTFSYVLREVWEGLSREGKVTVAWQYAVVRRDVRNLRKLLTSLERKINF